MLEVSPLGTLQLSQCATQAFDTLVEHLRNGRGGAPWCVWAVHALDQGGFWIGDARELGHRGFASIVSLAAEAFVKHCPPPDTDCVRAVVHRNSLTVLLADDVPWEDAEDTLQRERPNLLRRGLMVGLLHPRSTHAALTPGPDGTPYRMESPFLTIRWAVPEDELFVGINPELTHLLRRWISRTNINRETNR